MEKAHPVQMRKALMTVDAMRKSMLDFVPLPVLSKEDKIWLIDELKKRLDAIYEDCT